jgi:hypothetical protein
VVEQGDGTRSVSLDAAGSDSRYLALALSAVQSPASLMADVPSRLKWEGNGAAYVVIAPAALAEGAQSLAAYRSGQGLASTVVDIEDIYDEFNYGIVSPKAVQAFLAYAAGSWKTGPRYVVLAGRGTIDYKGIKGFRDNLVPPLLTGTPDGVFASDRRFAPGLPIGRLPAVTNAELEGMVQKIASYETSGGNWAKRVLVVADNADGDGDFPADSDDIAALLPASYKATKVYLGPSGIAAAREMLFAGLNDGAVLANYIGHAGMDRWAHEGLLKVSDVNGLSNGGCLPVITAFTCVAGRFDIPGYRCIGEALVLQGGGGAIAFYGPAGMSTSEQAKAQAEAVFEAAFVPGQRVLGDVLLQAQQGIGVDGGASRTYNLLGDPALRLRR